MRELFDLARQYGMVYIHTSEDGTYGVQIKFHTKVHTELKAHSGHNHKDVEDALRAAIINAQSIVDGVSEIQDRLLGKADAQISSQSKVQQIVGP